MKVFDASIEQMLWPEKRERDAVLGDKVPGTIDRTTLRSEIVIPAGYAPEALRGCVGRLHRWLPWLVGGGDILIGPIPKGMPVGLLANLKLRAESTNPKAIAAHAHDVGEMLLTLQLDLANAPANASDEDLRARFANLKAPMLRLSKCPDFVVNRGHYFGTAQFNQQAGLSTDEKAFGQIPALKDADKRALIEFLKTF